MDPTTNIVELDALLELQRLVRLSGAYARVLSANGDSEGAIEHALMGLRASKELTRGDGITLLPMILAAAYQSIAIHDLMAVVRDAHWLTRPIARPDSTPVQGLDPYHEGGGTLEPMPWPMSTLPLEYLWQPKRTLSWLADEYRERQRASARDCHAAILESSGSASGTDGPMQIVKALLLPNSMGRLTINISTPNLARFDLKRCHAETKFSLVRALVGARAYYAENGRADRSPAPPPDPATPAAASPSSRANHEPERRERPDPQAAEARRPPASTATRRTTAPKTPDRASLPSEASSDPSPHAVGH